MKNSFSLNGRYIGPSEPVYFVAEISANHNQSFERALEVIRAAKEAGADAVKVQTYTADTLTIKSSNPEFRVGGGTLWDGKTLYDLYREAYTPWDWQPKLKAFAEDLGLGFFSSPFDESAVEFLESLEVGAYKVASSEIVDIPLVRRLAATGKPLIVSCGMASLAEIEEAVVTILREGQSNVALLKCTTAYPTRPDEMNLRTIPHLQATFGLPVGLSDHSMGHAAALAAVTLGACIIEKHLTLRRSDGGADAPFSMEPEEFAEMVSGSRMVERALGGVAYGPTESETAAKRYRRSLYVCEPIRKGDPFTERNVRSIRPGAGLHTRHHQEIIGRHARADLDKGTALRWDMVE